MTEQQNWIKVCNATYRLRVRGGVLYKTIEYGNSEGESNAVAMVFVPLSAIQTDDTYPH